MTLLSSRPKNNESELYGRTEDLVKLNRHIEDQEPLIVISGLRRIGKTSLIKTALSKREYSIYIDGWKLGKIDVVTKQQILELFHGGIQKFFNKNLSKKEQFRKFFSSIAGFDFAGYGIQFHPPTMSEVTITNIFDILNDWAIEHEEIVVIAVDEVQEFSKSEDVDLRKIFSSFYNYDNIVLILTGSKIGALHRFIKKDDAEGAFYGKDRIEIDLEPLSKEESTGFLIKALSEAGISVRRTVPFDSTIDKAVLELGGVIGWLVNFGRQCVRDGKINEIAIKKIQDQGSVQMRKEFDHFAKINASKENSYNEIMKKLVQLPHFYFDKYIKDEELEDDLNDIAKEGFIKKDSKDRWYFADRLLEYSFRQEVDLVRKTNIKIKIKKSNSGKSKKQKKRKKNR